VRTDYERLSEAVTKAGFERQNFLGARLLLSRNPVSPEEAWDAAIRAVLMYEKKLVEQDFGTVENWKAQRNGS
jgi:hypothetical protein